MTIRDSVVSARTQAAMALRYHAGEGNLKWVSLLLWAGADPRLPVPDLDARNSTDSDSSALEEAVSNGKLAVVKKIGVDPAQDDPTALLGRCWLCEEPALVKILIDAGADPNGGEGERQPMRALMRSFEWSLEPLFTRRSPERAIQCLEVAARHGGRWRPDTPYDRTCLRRRLAEAAPWDAIRHLQRLVAAGVFTREVFQDLMSTPRMRELLAGSISHVRSLREFAGISDLIEANAGKSKKLPVARGSNTPPRAGKRAL